MLVGILYFLYFVFVLGIVVLTPCYFLPKLREKVFKHPRIYIFFKASILFNVLTIVLGIIAWEEALTNLNLLNANIFEKSTGIFSYAYGWLLPYWGWLIVIVSVLISLGVEFVLGRKELKKSKD